MTGKTFAQGSVADMATRQQWCHEQCHVQSAKAKGQMGDSVYSKMLDNSPLALRMRSLGASREANSPRPCDHKKVGKPGKHVFFSRAHCGWL